MARIVPAKPRCDNDGEEAALIALERSLDDSHIILQKRPKSGSFLIAHPDLGICCLLVKGGQRIFDPDLDGWDGADLDAAIQDAKKMVPGLASRTSAAAFLWETSRPLDKNSQGIAFENEAHLLTGLVGLALGSSSSIGDKGMDALIQSVAPGAAAYVRGDVTPAQRDWRDSRDTIHPIAQETISPLSAVAVSTTSLGVMEATPNPLTLSDPLGLASPSVGGDVVVASPVKIESKIPPFEEVDDLHPVIMLLRQAAETVIKDRQIFVAGVSISPSELTSTDFLLPALVVAAAEDWAPIVASKKGIGGFLVRLRSAPDSLLGYRVAAIQPSAPLLMLLPVVDRIKRHVRTNKGKEEIMMDETVNRFRQWLEAHRFDTEAVSEIDLRVALSIH